ncbi:unnamed protein product [Periconia digitata]|uniref:Uncharacterized protein n=1 Tax=Periconia digitata TaxID=1303443 RepID=A0A9W4UR12_9PLEO|nr:unnamed protein product [Periconia digitata]
MAAFAPLIPFWTAVSDTHHLIKNPKTHYNKLDRYILGMKNQSDYSNYNQDVDVDSRV